MRRWPASVDGSKGTLVLIGAPASVDRSLVALLYLDVVLVLIAVPLALAAGAPAVGLIVGALAWIIGRAASSVAEKKIAAMEDFRRQIGFGVASSMLRVWLLACSIIGLGIAVSREDALTAALVIFGAFSVYFVKSAVGQYTSRRSPAR
jgi:hypothetical protein